MVGISEHRFDNSEDRFSQADSGMAFPSDLDILGLTFDAGLSVTRDLTVLQEAILLHLLAGHSFSHYE